MTVWWGQIVAAVAYTAVLIGVLVFAIRRRDRRFVALVLAFGVAQLTVSTYVIVTTAP